MGSVICDASAILAYLFGETGANIVQDHLSGAAISTVNLTEVIARLMRDGASAEKALDVMNAFDLRILPWDQRCVRLASFLSPYGWTHGLSLADRACLATAQVVKLDVLTAEKSWRDLPNIGVKIQCIR